MAVRKQPKKFIRKKSMDETQVQEPIEETPVETTGEQEVSDAVDVVEEEKKNESGTPDTAVEETPAEVAIDGFQEGDSVKITSENVVALFGTSEATFVSYLPGRVEAKVLVNGEEKVIGVESIE